MPASQSACHSFVDAGRRQETPGSETKDLLLLPARALARVPAFMLVSWVPFLTGRWREDRVTPTYEVGCVTGEEPQAPVFYGGRLSSLNFVPEGDIILTAWDTANLPSSPEGDTRSVFQKKAIRAFAHKTCRDARGSWRIVYQQTFTFLIFSLNSHLFRSFKTF